MRRRNTHHRRPGFSPALLYSAIVAVTCGCGDPLDPLLGTSRPSPVVVLDTQGLVSPVVPEPHVYRPAEFVPVADSAAPSATAAVFEITVAAESPDQILLLVSQHSGMDSSVLSRVPAPSDARSLSWAEGDALEHLQAGAGVYWIVGTAGSHETRIGVALPEPLLSNTVTLQIFDDYAPDGTPVGPAVVRIARDFFYMAVIGDSVAWGNGLREQQKYSTLVGEEIEARTGLHVVRQVHAISGSTIVPPPGEIPCRVWCNGEVQIASTSVTTQVDLLVRPEVLDLILMDGCVNDVSVETILDSDTTEEELTGLTNEFCHDAMAGLLEKVRATAPQAKVVVTGYFPIISSESRLQDLAVFIGLGEQEPAEETPALGEQATINSRVFLETAHAGLEQAVEEANAAAPGPPVSFVDPQFGPGNAMFTTDAWLWGLTSNRVQQEQLDESLTLFPEDPLADFRAKSCFNDILIDPISCLYASVGHPNPRGARAYADRILAALEESGFIPTSRPE